MPENLEKRLKRQIHGKLHHFTVIVPLGFESTLVKELRQIGIIAENDTFDTIDGRVSFTAKITEAWKTVALSRIANRVLMGIASFKAENFRELEKKVAEIPWELYLPCHPERSNTSCEVEGSVSIHVTCKHSRLYHSDAIAERFYKIFNGGSTETVMQHLYINLIDDRCTVSLDLAGEELYKRGHERFVAEAPLKETIAAAMLFEAGYFTSSRAVLLDPMAGSGTFSLEAAYMTSGLIPGKCRDFALKHQPAFKDATWNFILKNANPASKEQNNSKVQILTSDISDRAINIIRHNIESTPLAKTAPDLIKLQKRNFFSYTPEEIARIRQDRFPILVLNPPYGKRLDADAPKLYAEIGRKLKDFTGWTVAILAPKGPCTENLLHHCPALNGVSTRKIKTSHGGFSLNCIITNL